jgi:hypothetical protein
VSIVLMHWNRIMPGAVVLTSNTFSTVTSVSVSKDGWWMPGVHLKISMRSAGQTFYRLPSLSSLDVRNMRAELWGLCWEP